MSYIPRSRVVEPLSDGAITLLILPEYPSTYMPVRVWMNGQRVTADDCTVEGDAISLDGDYSSYSFEVDYFVAVASFVPRTARVQGVVNGALTRLTLPELPVDTLPVIVHAGGQRISLENTTLSGAVVTLDSVWEGWWFDVDYYISAALPVTVVSGSTGGTTGTATGGSSTNTTGYTTFGGVADGDYAGSGAMSTNQTETATVTGSDAFAGGDIPSFTPDDVWTNSTGETIEGESPEPEETPVTDPAPVEETATDEATETPAQPEPFTPDDFWEGV